MPVLVNKSKEVILSLGVKEKDIDFDNLCKPEFLNGLKVTKVNKLFPRLGAEDVEYVKSLMVSK